MDLLSLVLLTIVTAQLAQAKHEPFDNSLSNYEQLTSNQFHFSSTNNNPRKRRDEPSQQIIDHLDSTDTNELKFSAFGRQYHLVLRPGANLITSAESSLNIEVRYADGRKHQIDDTFTSNYYKGRVVGSPSSSALVYYDTQTLANRQPLIYAKISTYNETLYVEPRLNSTHTSYIVYKSDDVRTGLFSNGFFNQSYCHAINLNSNADAEQPSKADERLLKKRQTEGSSTNNRCGLALVADWTFFEKIGNSDEKLTTLYMVCLVHLLSSLTLFLF